MKRQFRFIFFIITVFFIGSVYATTHIYKQSIRPKYSEPSISVTFNNPGDQWKPVHVLKFTTHQIFVYRLKEQKPGHKADSLEVFLVALPKADQTKTIKELYQSYVIKKFHSACPSMTTQPVHTKKDELYFELHMDKCAKRATALNSEFILGRIKRDENNLMTVFYTTKTATLTRKQKHQMIGLLKTFKIVKQ